MTIETQKNVCVALRPSNATLTLHLSHVWQCDQDGICNVEASVHSDI